MQIGMVFLSRNMLRCMLFPYPFCDLAYMYVVLIFARSIDLAIHHKDKHNRCIVCRLVVPLSIMHNPRDVRFYAIGSIRSR